MDAPIELIVETGPRGFIRYVGHLIGETEDKVALVSYIAPGKKLPPAVTISKSRITERCVLVRKRAKQEVSQSDR